MPTVSLNITLHFFGMSPSSSVVSRIVFHNDVAVMCVNIYPVWGGSSVEGAGISCMILIPTTITENTDPLNLISLARPPARQPPTPHTGSLLSQHTGAFTDI